MVLNSVFLLLIGSFVTTLSVDISKGPFLVRITSSETERHNPNEIFDKIKEPEPFSNEYPIEESELEKEYEFPSAREEYHMEKPEPFSNEYPIEESELEKEYEFPLAREEYHMERNIPGREGYPDYLYEDLNVKESSAFKEQWYNTGAMEISYIGEFDPSVDKDKRRRREAAWKKTILRKRDVKKAFSRTVGCNRLPVAPFHAFGICHHSNSIGKCWVRCHRFSRYPDDAKQKALICQKGLWQPTKLPDCVQQTLCEEREISGNNMYVSCISEKEETKCTGTCEDGFTFPDNETVKEIECEELDGEFVNRAKFPDCSFSGDTSYTSVNKAEEPTNDTWIYF